jgi:uncharacterized protein (DUF427 family)
MNDVKTDNRAPGFRTDPHHRVAIAPAGGRVRVAVGGTVLGDSTRALVVEETGYPLRYYLPRGDVAMERLRRAAHRTHCPFKGDAVYWDVEVEGTVAENAAWSYEAPFDEASPLAGLVAFWIERLPGATLAPG